MAKKILVVDDFEGNRDLLEDILSECYETDTAADGQEAIEKISKNADYSMVLLDLMMPKIDGFGVLEYMRENDLLERCPVIIISGDSNAETEGRCFDYGVSDFIAKPFKEKIILKRVENILSLKEAIRRAELANESKTAFLLNLSHDIRTPMNAIMGYSELMDKNQALDERTKGYLKRIRTSGSFLLSLINSVLEISRIESGLIVLDDECVELEPIFQSVYDVFCERMSQKNISFTYDARLTTRYVHMDTLKVDQILLNLLSNAYKYTEEGGSVSFTAQEMPCDKDGHAAIEIKVADTGMGMSEDYLPVLFEQFTREQSSAVNRIEGTGLGMPIVKKMIDLMGGTIEVESKLGQGSTFTVRLIFKVAEEPAGAQTAAHEADASILEGKRILLAEDDEINAELATIILEESGMIVDRAEDGQICVDKLSASTDNYYDLILMDVQMPNLDGCSATRKIRALDNPYQKNIPVIAMTAEAFAENIRTCREAGMDGHVAKPVDIELLLETMVGKLAGNER